MIDAIPVTLRYEYSWRSGRPPWELCNMLNALSVSDFRTIQEGAVERLGLDAATRRKQDNTLTLDKEKEGWIKSARKINKALAMELVVSSLLTYIDHPELVISGCSVNRNGLPHYFAPALAPDIVVQPAGARHSRFVFCVIFGPFFVLIKRYFFLPGQISVASSLS